MRLENNEDYKIKLSNGKTILISEQTYKGIYGTFQQGGDNKLENFIRFPDAIGIEWVVNLSHVLYIEEL